MVSEVYLLKTLDHYTRYQATSGRGSPLAETDHWFYTRVGVIHSNSPMSGEAL